MFRSTVSCTFYMNIVHCQDKMWEILHRISTIPFKTRNYSDPFLKMTFHVFLLTFSFVFVGLRPFGVVEKNQFNQICEIKEKKKVNWSDVRPEVHSHTSHFISHIQFNLLWEIFSLRVDFAQCKSSHWTVYTDLTVNPIAGHKFQCNTFSKLRLYGFT